MVVLPLPEGPTSAVTPERASLVLAVIAVGATVLAVVRATRVAEPFLDVRLFRRVGFSAATLVSLLTGYAFATAIIGGAVFVDRVLYGGPDEQRLALGALAETTAIGALGSGFAVRIASYRVVTVVGLGASILALVVMSRWTPATTIGEAAIVPGIIQSIREINPAIPVQFRSMESFVTSSLTSERLMAALSGFFGGLAVLIAVIGLYGVMSYMVTRRRAEIGIRMALGADRGAVIRMVVGDAGRLLLVGLVAGVALAIFGARSAAALLYGLAPWDPGTLALAAATLGAVALLACWVPAYRASRVSPTTALRVE